MELNVSRQTLFIHETILDAGVEQPVECDVLLPDYCPDIARVLKCALEPAITVAQVQGARLNIEGVGVVTVWYCAQGGGLRRSEYRVPFAKSVELRAEPTCPLVNVVPRCDYVNCRSVSSRRLDIRGAVTLNIKLTDIREENVIATAEGMGVELKAESYSATRVLCQVARPFQMSEVLDLATGKPAVQCLVRCDATPRVGDIKVMAGKVMVKGTLGLEMLYMGTDDSCQRMEYTLPISQICDVDGADEGCTADVHIDTCTLSCEPRGEGAEDTGFSVDVAMMLVVRMHRDYRVTAAADAYSVKYRCANQTRPLSTLLLCEAVNTNMIYKDEMDLPDGVETIGDLWCKVLSWSTRVDGMEACVAGRLCVSLFATGEGGEVNYFEKLVDFEDKLPLPDGCQNPVFDPAVRLLSCSYSMGSGGKMEVRCELCISGCLYSGCRHQLLTELTVDEKRELETVVKRGLYLYMADSGEPLWDIAKRYNTSIARIMEENDLDCDRTAGRTMLLVPVV